MPHYLDRHDDVDISADELARLHLTDLSVQGRYGVDFLTYWYDYRQHKAYCLVEAPSATTAIEVHAQAHGNLPSEIIQVDLGEVLRALGRVADPVTDQPIDEPATRTILFTDIVGSTTWIDRRGDDFGIELVRIHDEAVYAVRSKHGGREVKHTGDGVMLAFDSPADAVRLSIEVQRNLAELRASQPEYPLEIRIGVNTGEPVTKGADLFGAAVNLAARLCEVAEAGSILVSAAVRDLTSGEGFSYEEPRIISLRGFEKPVAVSALRWRVAPEAPSPA